MMLYVPQDVVGVCSLGGLGDVLYILVSSGVAGL